MSVVSFALAVVFIMLGRFMAMFIMHSFVSDLFAYSGVKNNHLEKYKLLERRWYCYTIFIDVKDVFGYVVQTRVSY